MAFRFDDLLSLADFGDPFGDCLGESLGLSLGVFGRKQEALVKDSKSMVTKSDSRKGRVRILAVFVCQ